MKFTFHIYDRIRALYTRHETTMSKHRLQVAFAFFLIVRYSRLIILWWKYPILGQVTKKKQNSELLKFQLTFIFDKNAQNRTKFVRPRPGSRLTSKAFPPFIDLNNKFKFWKWGWFKKQQKTAPTTARVKWANCRRAFSWKKKFNLAFLFFS